MIRQLKKYTRRHRFRDLWLILTKYDYIIVLPGEEPEPENNDTGVVTHCETVPKWVARVALKTAVTNVSQDLAEEETLEALKKELCLTGSN